MLHGKLRIKLSLFLIFFLTFLRLELISSANHADQDKFYIIVNSDNEYRSQINQGIRKIKFIYMGNSKEWPGKIKAKFFSRGNTNPSQLLFYKKILNMELKDVSDYWIKNSDKGLYEPETIEDVRILINKIAKTKGAISFVSKNEIKKLPAKIKILYEF